MGYFIAEIGQNHNGSLERAKMLVDSLKGTSVNAIKTAKRTVKNFPKKWKDKEYKGVNSFADNYYDHRCALELSDRDFVEFAEYVRKCGFDFISSFTDVDAFRFLLHKVRPDYYKIASSRVVDYNLLREVARHDVPVILSTGMSSINDVYIAEKILNPKVIMQCTSAYPCELYNLNLNVIHEYIKKFPTARIGFSNHLPATFACETAYTLGAEWLEFHYTLNKTDKGTDHPLSFTRSDVDNLLNHCVKVDISRGSSGKYVEKCEYAAIDKLRSDL